MPFLKRAGKPDLHYEVDDYTDPWKNAPWILLQHGFGRSSRFWYAWVPYLSRHYKVLRPDLRGLGQSAADFDLEHELRLEDYFGDMQDLIAHVGAKDVHYCGESLGGILGMPFAAEHPDRVRTLTVIASTVKEHTARGTDYLKGQSRLEAIEKLGARAWAEASGAGRRFPPDADPGFLKWFADEMGRSNTQVLLAMNRNVVANFDASDYLPRIQAPMLGVYPTAGPITNEEQIDFLKAQVADITIVRLPSRYHSINILQPAACAQHLLHFAARRDGLPCHE
jgi:3-oxoadipate enol-lactonase